MGYSPSFFSGLQRIRMGVPKPLSSDMRGLVAFSPLNQDPFGARIPEAASVD